MKTILKVLFVLCLLCKVTPANASDYFHMNIDANYLSGFSKRVVFWDPFSHMHGLDLNIYGMYDISDRFSMGGGIGFEGLHLTEDPLASSYGIFPVFARVEYKPFQQFKKSFVFAKIGCGIGDEKGFMSNLGWGYRVPLSRGFAMNIMIGYHVQYLEDGVYVPLDMIDEMSGIEKIYKHSLSLGVGIQF